MRNQPETEVSASQPNTDGKSYHTHTRRGDLADFVIVAGAPGRVRAISEHLREPVFFENDKRGILSCTGFYQGVRVSASTHGMGTASLFITLPEILQSTENPEKAIIVRQGSCGSLIKDSEPGDVLLVRGAFSWDAASLAAAPRDERRQAFRMLSHEHWWDESLYVAADKGLADKFWELASTSDHGTHVHSCVEYTTADFVWEQGRPDQDGYVPQYLLGRHESALAQGSACYSMEAAALYRMMKSERVIAVNAVYAQRHTDKFVAGAGDDLATQMILSLAVSLADEGR